MYDFSSIDPTTFITVKTWSTEDRTAHYELEMSKFRGHYYSVVCICTSMIYAFLMKLLFRFLQKDR